MTIQPNSIWKHQISGRLAYGHYTHGPKGFFVEYLCGHLELNIHSTGFVDGFSYPFTPESWDYWCAI